MNPSHGNVFWTSLIFSLINITLSEFYSPLGLYVGRAQETLGIQTLKQTFPSSWQIWGPWKGQGEWHAEILGKGCSYSTEGLFNGNMVPWEVMLALASLSMAAKGWELMPFWAAFIFAWLFVGLQGSAVPWLPNSLIQVGAEGLLWVAMEGEAHHGTTFLLCFYLCKCRAHLVWKVNVSDAKPTSTGEI